MSVTRSRRSEPATTQPQGPTLKWKATRNTALPGDIYSKDRGSIPRYVGNPCKVPRLGRCLHAVRSKGGLSLNRRHQKRQNSEHQMHLRDLRRGHRPTQLNRWQKAKRRSRTRWRCFSAVIGCRLRRCLGYVAGRTQQRRRARAARARRTRKAQRQALRAKTRQLSLSCSCKLSSARCANARESATTFAACAWSQDECCAQRALLSAWSRQY